MSANTPSDGKNVMTRFVKTFGAVSIGALLTASASAQSAKEVHAPSPFVAIENEPPAKLVVDPPLPDQLAQGIVQLQYRVENVRIVPVFGANALNLSPRIGHLHITVDDLPWHWADTSDNNTIDIVGLPPGPHKVRVELVDAAHHVFASQSAVVRFAVPDATPLMH
jgi:hypothetical protein